MTGMNPDSRVWSEQGALLGYPQSARDPETDWAGIVG